MTEAKFVTRSYLFTIVNAWVTILFTYLVTLYNTGALISINSCLTNAQIILN